MTRRRGLRKRQRWWSLVVAFVIGGLAVWWWLDFRRVEVPAAPATVSAPPAIGQQQSPEEITEQEKEELQRLLREHATEAAPAR